MAQGNRVYEKTGIGQPHGISPSLMANKESPLFLVSECGLNEQTMSFQLRQGNHEASRQLLPQVT